MLRALHLDPDAVLGGDAQSYEDRFRLLQDVADALHAAGQPIGLVVILEDLHWADEPPLRVMRHLADQLGDARLLVLVTYRDTEPADDLRRVRNRPGAHRSDGSALALARVSSNAGSMAIATRPIVPTGAVSQDGSRYPAKCSARPTDRTRPMVCHPSRTTAFSRCGPSAA